MRIGIVTDFYFPWIGGPSQVVRGLAHGLAERGHIVSLLAPSADGAPAVEREGRVEVERARTAPLPFGYGVRVARNPYRTASRWVERTRPDIVHVHHPFPLSAAAVSAAGKRGVPVAATNHTVPQCSLWGMRNTAPLYGAAYLLFSAWLRSLLGRCSAVATPTATAASMLQDLGFDAPVEVISNGVDVERFRPGPEETNLRDELGLDGRPVVLYTGRLDPEKSMDVWLRAARATVGSCQAQFLVGGQGVDRERLEALAADLELQNHLRFIGYLPADRYPDLYRLADVYCIAAPVELQSISTLEAVSSGVPVVAVKAGALPELVHHEVNGLLVPSGDSRAMSRALVALLNDSDRRVGMGAAGRRLALEHALDRSLDRYESFLSAAAARAGGEKSLERASAGGY